jgi:hypothetical protein
MACYLNTFRLGGIRFAKELIHRIPDLHLLVSKAMQQLPETHSATVL